MDLFQYRTSLDMLNDSTLIDEEYDYEYDYIDDSFIAPYLQDIIFSIVISIISICLFVFILAKKELRGMPTCWLVINVLVAAMIHGILILPVTADSYTGGWKLGAVGCYFYIVLYSINHMHIHVGLLLLLIDRFISFLDQKKHAERMTPKVVRILIISSVAILFVVCILVTYVSGTPYFEHYSRYDYCGNATTNSMQHLIETIMIKTLPVAQNILFGFITLFTAIAKRHNLTTDNQEERVKNWQAVVFILLIGLLNVSLCLTVNICQLTGYITSDTWIIMNFLDSLFYVLVLVLIMVLIPDIRIAMGSCCKKEKKGENQPLVKPM